MAKNNMETFAKISTRLWQNEKVRTLAMEHPSAFAVWTFAISYCAGELNDGELSRFHLKCLLGASDEDIDALIDAHLLDKHENGTLWLHDFVEAQGRSRADVEAAKERKAEAGRQGGKASGESRYAKQPASKPKQPRSISEAEPKQPRSISEAEPKQPRSKTKPDTDTDTDTDTDKNSSNEEFSLPQTPSVEGAGEEEQETEAIRENTADDHAISFEQAQEIVRRVREFYPAVKFRGRSYEPGIILQSDAILRVAGSQPDIVDWFVARCRAYVEHQSEPRYVTEFATYVRGGGPSGKRPYWEIDWASQPMPVDPRQEAEAKRHERNMRDVDYLCRHWRDEECQLAALELPEKAQALARARYPDEWYKLWRRGTKLKEREKQAAKTPADAHPNTSTGVP
ncbi:hypothetical protein BTIS_1077 [Bifidobacterium tissieri]|uniref:Uncharacterized protein n=1 Tax=Bifidobacterium tissieri TaxID=1630162 RepID=A0A261FG12_9BIFI|nr:hypothetical protein [Bifidobacterium tissieri]OZG57836.1 hypothetical protein BTIS_1077 [Bifidobacterium tissieri]